MKTSIWIQITAVATATLLAAGTPATIGAANVVGNFRLNSHSASAHATISEGAVMETAAASGDISLAGGAHVVLGPGAESQVYKDRMVLLHGAAQLENSDHYSLDARGLRVFATDAKGIASVSMTKSGVQVNAVSGQARVLNTKGDLLAWVPPGKALSFDGAPEDRPTTLTVTGKLTKEDGRFYIVDQTTGLKIEVREGNLTKFVGKVVRIAGAVLPVVPPKGVAYIITATSVQTLAGAGAAAAGAGVALGTKAAIIAGTTIVVAGTAVGVVKANRSSAPLSQ